ncbi:hypothetical protein Y032_0024g1029 [Ancylostoma ceylanicum]|uniref:Uncharacterized protein n=1 Tax=Ancylostoma ceylanicum TaxID=53326 RepID=A0A016UVU2_9BILA|nr:hypothetical protein Y032_0024g1029 [Ancylostoma ceylanicum]
MERQGPAERPLAQMTDRRARPCRSPGAKLQFIYLFIYLLHETCAKGNNQQASLLIQTSINIMQANCNKGPG